MPSSCTHFRRAVNRCAYGTGVGWFPWQRVFRRLHDHGSVRAVGSDPWEYLLLLDFYQVHIAVLGRSGVRDVKITIENQISPVAADRSSRDSTVILRSTRPCVSETIDLRAVDFHQDQFFEIRRPQSLPCTDQILWKETRVVRTGALVKHGQQHPFSRGTVRAVAIADFPGWYLGIRRCADQAVDRHFCVDVDDSQAGPFFCAAGVQGINSIGGTDHHFAALQVRSHVRISRTIFTRLPVQRAVSVVNALRAVTEGSSGKKHFARWEYLDLMPAAFLGAHNQLVGNYGIGSQVVDNIPILAGPAPRARPVNPNLGAVIRDVFLIRDHATGKASERVQGSAGDGVA